MAVTRGLIKIHWPVEEPSNINYGVASGAVQTIVAGSPTKVGTVGNVVPMVDGDGTTSQRFTGIAKNDSSDTATVAGIVAVYLPLPGLIYECAAKTASLANTAALISALVYKRVKFGLVSSTTWTIDTAQSDATTNGIVILGGDPNTSTIFFAVSPQITIFDNPTT
jgi:hypothetical protein